jgi:hypothetical protein
MTGSLSQPFRATAIHAPIFRAVSFDEEVQAAAIGQLVRLVLGLGVARVNIGQRGGELRHFDGISASNGG